MKRLIPLLFLAIFIAGCQRDSNPPVVQPPHVQKVSPNRFLVPVNWAPEASHLCNGHSDSTSSEGANNGNNFMIHFDYWSKVNRFYVECKYNSNRFPVSEVKKLNGR